MPRLVIELVSSGNTIAMSETILVIERDPDLSRLFKSLLEVEGYQSTAARTLDEAREYLAQQPFDLIVYDLSLTNNAGFAFLEEHYTSAQQGHVPVLVVCDISPSRAILELLAGYGVALIEKPFDVRQFSTYVANLVERRERAVGM